MPPGIELSDDVPEYRVFRVRNPARVIVDFEGATLAPGLAVDGDAKHAIRDGVQVLGIPIDQMGKVNEFPKSTYRQYQRYVEAGQPPRLRIITHQQLVHRQVEHIAPVVQHARLRERVRAQHLARREQRVLEPGGVRGGRAEARPAS